MPDLNPWDDGGDQSQMAKLIGELLFELVRSLVGDLLERAVLKKVGAWLDTKLASRKARIVVGGLLGLAAYFLIPIFAGLLGF